MGRETDAPPPFSCFAGLGGTFDRLYVLTIVVSSFIARHRRLRKPSCLLRQNDVHAVVRDYDVDSRGLC